MAQRNFWLVIILPGLATLSSGCQPPAQSLEPFRPPPTAPATQPGCQAAITPAEQPSDNSSIRIAESTHTLTGSSLRMCDLISVAYRTPAGRQNLVPPLSALRVISAEPLPDQRYDVHVFLPGGDASQLRACLREALAASYGLVARCQPRETEVLLLTAPAGRLKEGAPTGQPPAQPGPNCVVLDGDDLSLLAEQLEELLQRPVVNETGLRVPYELVLRRPVKDGQPQPVSVGHAQAALREQLGLELAPATRTIEYVVVQKLRPGRSGQ